MDQLNFFNTVNLNGEKLSTAVKNVQTQGDRVYTIMKRKAIPMTPADVHESYERLYGHCPITSIRRAISDLTRMGYLEKTYFRKPGIYKMDNYTWKVNVFKIV
jgi:hypothetical protein